MLGLLYQILQTVSRKGLVFQSQGLSLYDGRQLGYTILPRRRIDFYFPGGFLGNIFTIEFTAVLQ